MYPCQSYKSGATTRAVAGFTSLPLLDKFPLNLSEDLKFQGWQLSTSTTHYHIIVGPCLSHVLVIQRVSSVPVHNRPCHDQLSAENKPNTVSGNFPPKHQPYTGNTGPWNWCASSRPLHHPEFLRCPELLVGSLTVKKLGRAVVSLWMLVA